MENVQVPAEEKAKLIGIVGYKSSDGTSFGAGINYLEFFSTFGDVRILMPHDEVVEELDLLVLPGGLDLNPTAYGQVPRYRTTNQDVFKQFFYDNRLPAYINKRIPIFGICLGMQQICAYFGSNLVQNLTAHKSSPDRWQGAHRVAVEGKPEFMKSFAGFEVNSHHHQCVLETELGEALVPLATVKSEDWEGEKIVEAVAHSELPIIGVQWHPEEWYDEFSMNAVKHLLKIVE